MKKFTMINTPFDCEQCQKKIVIHPEWSARNHCPFCLYSKHLDKDSPGDRLSTCLSLMKPIGIDYKKNKGNMVRHKRIKCNKVILNKIAPDDDFLTFVQDLNNNKKRA